MLYGGSGCGKSTFAEGLASVLPGPRYYIATMRPEGEESGRRIRRHRAMREPKGFQTLERYTDLAGVVLPKSGGVALVECLCNLTANEIFDPEGAGPEGAEASALAGLNSLARQCANLIVVTNEVGADGAGYEEPVLRYIRVLGNLNRCLAAAFDQVAELVCGIPLWLKGGPA